MLGNQWYWSFSLKREINSFLKESFSTNSYIKSVNNEKFESLKVFNVDNKILVPRLTSIRVLISRRDVIHSWSLPSIGIKIDAIPGRINQLEVYFKSIGVFFGQCTEICGINHRIMPFILFSLPLKDCLIFESLTNFLLD